MRNKFGSPSPQPQIRSRPLSHAPSLLPARPSTPTESFPLFPAAAATTHGLSEPLQDPSRSRRPRSLSTATAAAAAARSPPLPTGPDWAPLPVRLGHVSHLNDTVLGRGELVLQPEQPRETKAAENRAGRGGRGFLLSQVAALNFFQGLLPLGSLSSSVVWHCSRYAHAHRLKMFCFRKSPA